MERTHPRDIQSPAARAAMASFTTTTTTAATTPDSNGLLRRGISAARSVLLRQRCVSNAQIDTCEKPSLSTGATLGIMTAIGVVAAVLIVAILIMLHMRRRRVLAEEFAHDRHGLDDYGLDEYGGKKAGGGGAQQAPPARKHFRMSSQELEAAENPFGTGKAPPKQTDAAKM